MVEFVEEFKREDDGVTEYYFTTDEVDGLYDDRVYSDELEDGDVQIIGHEVKIEIDRTGEARMFIGMIVEDEFGDAEDRNYEEIGLYGSGVIVDTLLALVDTLNDNLKRAEK